VRAEIARRGGFGGIAEEPLDPQHIVDPDGNIIDLIKGTIVLKEDGRVIEFRDLDVGQFLIRGQLVPLDQIPRILGNLFLIELRALEKELVTALQVKAPDIDLSHQILTREDKLVRESLDPKLPQNIDELLRLRAPIDKQIRDLEGQRAPLVQLEQQILALEAERARLEAELASLVAIRDGLFKEQLAINFRLSFLDAEVAGLELQLRDIATRKQLELDGLAVGSSELQLQEVDYLALNLGLSLAQEDIRAGKLLDRFRGELSANRTDLKAMQAQLAGLAITRDELEAALTRAQADDDGPVRVRLVALGIENQIGGIDFPGGNALGGGGAEEDAREQPPPAPEEHDPVAHDEFSGFQVWLNLVTGETVFRDPVDPATLDDDVFYEWEGAVEPGLFRFEGGYSIERFVGYTHENRTERRLDTRQEYTVVITSPLKSVATFTGTFFKATGGLDPSGETLFILDEDTDALVEFEEFVRAQEPNQETEVIFLYLDDSLDDLGITADDGDTIVRFHDLRPVYTEIPSGEIEFTNFDAVADSVVEELALFYAE
ncbi:MAG: hypothetical protein ACRD2T_01310, partial [Thermoanaerobaculia bacterium]